MPKYIVRRREVWTQAFEVDATDVDSAVDLVHEHDDNHPNVKMLEDLLEFSHIMNKGHTSAERVK